MADRVGVLIHKREAAGGQLLKVAEAKAQKNALLDPGVNPPAGGRGGVRRGGADFTAFDGGAQGKEGCRRSWVAHGGGSGGIVPLNFLLELAYRHFILSLSTQGGMTMVGAG